MKLNSPALSASLHQLYSSQLCLINHGGLIPIVTSEDDGLPEQDGVEDDDDDEGKATLGLECAVY